MKELADEAELGVDEDVEALDVGNSDGDAGDDDDDDAKAAAE